MWLPLCKLIKTCRSQSCCLFSLSLKVSEGAWEPSMCTISCWYVPIYLVFLPHNSILSVILWAQAILIRYLMLLFQHTSFLSAAIIVVFPRQSSQKVQRRHNTLHRYEIMEYQPPRFVKLYGVSDFHDSWDSIWFQRDEQDPSLIRIKYISEIQLTGWYR